MFRFIARRLLLMPLSILIVMLVVFVVLRITGDPVEIYLGIESTPEQEAVLIEKLHLDEPLPMQFMIFLSDAVQGDFGESLQYGEPAMKIVVSRLWPTIQLLIMGLSVAVVGGVLLGITCAVWKDRLSGEQSVRGNWSIVPGAHRGELGRQSRYRAEGVLSVQSASCAGDGRAGRRRRDCEHVIRPRTACVENRHGVWVCKGRRVAVNSEYGSRPRRTRDSLQRHPARVYGHRSRVWDGRSRGWKHSGKPP